MQAWVEFHWPFRSRRSIETAAAAVVERCFEGVRRHVAGPIATMGEAEAMGYVRTKSAVVLEQAVEHVCRETGVAERLRPAIVERAADLLFEALLRRRAEFSAAAGGKRRAA